MNVTTHTLVVDYVLEAFANKEMFVVLLAQITMIALALVLCAAVAK